MGGGGTACQHFYISLKKRLKSFCEQISMIEKSYLKMFDVNGKN